MLGPKYRKNQCHVILCKRFSKSPTDEAESFTIGVQPCSVVLVNTAVPMLDLIPKIDLISMRPSPLPKHMSIICYNMPLSHQKVCECNHTPE